MVECKLPKLDVAGSSPVSRSTRLAPAALPSTGSGQALACGERAKRVEPWQASFVLVWVNSRGECPERGLELSCGELASLMAGHFSAEANGPLPALSLSKGAGERLVVSKQQKESKQEFSQSETQQSNSRIAYPFPCRWLSRLRGLAAVPDLPRQTRHKEYYHKRHHRRVSFLDLGRKKTSA